MEMTGSATALVHPNATPRADRDLVRARTVARVMDHYLVDPLIGFVLPGVGDVIGAVIGLYIVFVAWRRRVAAVVIARMLMNLVFDTLIGLVPVIGDTVDGWFQANQRNADLLIARAGAGGRASARDWAVVGAAAFALVAVLAAVVWGVVALVRVL